MTSKKLAVIFISAFVLGLAFIFGLFLVNRNRNAIVPGSIFRAIEQGGPYEVEYIITKKPESVNEKDEHGSTPLHLAAVFGQRAIVILLLCSGADVNATNAGLATPLYNAALNNHCDGTVQDLIKYGANVNMKLRSGKTLLESLITKIQNRGARPNRIITSPDGNEYIDYYDKKAGMETLKILLSNGADTNTKSSMGRIPLMIQAVSDGSLEIVEAFLAAGANVNMCREANISALHVAVLANNKAMVELLLSHGANVNAEATGRATPLFWAEYYKSEDIAELLLKYGGRVVDVGNEKP